MCLLRKYCSEICYIDNLNTYIISPAQYDSFFADQELFEKLNLPSWTSNLIMNIIQSAKKADGLRLAFAHHKDRENQSLEWWPVLCYKHENAFFHVMYRNSWMCRECGHKLYAPIIMPMCEADPDFYFGTRNRFPDIPQFFQKIPCPKCNRPLQNHLIILTL